MLQKTPVNINFSQGLNTKTDPKQVSLGQFLSLTNSVFTNQGLLQKRNGFGILSSLPDTSTKALTTFNGGLTAIGSELESYSSAANIWANKGTLQLSSLETIQLVRNSANQTFCDAVVAPNGLACVTFISSSAAGTSYQYSVLDSTTGQVIVSPTAIVATSGNVNESPRVFALPNYFVIGFGTSTGHIQYIAVAINNPTIVTTAADLTSGYTTASRIPWDGAVGANGNLYFAWNSTSGGQSVKVAYLPSILSTVLSPVVFALETATLMTVTVDNTNPSTPIIFAIYYDSGSSNLKYVVLDQNLNIILNPTLIQNQANIVNIASASAGTATVLNQIDVYTEISAAYSWTGATNFLKTIRIDKAGTIGTYLAVARSVGLASKAFYLPALAMTAVLVAYSSAYQPSYFLMNRSGNVLGKLAYSNGGGYLTIGLPGVSVSGNTVQMPYRIKDLLESTNKGTNLASSTPISPVFAQTGVNLATFDFDINATTTAEIGGTLLIASSLLWSYDGNLPVEQGFNLWPDNVNVTTVAAGGSITAQDYFYQVTYEWTDNNGNINRSAPSVPVKITVAAGSSTNTIKVPTLRLTYKTNVIIQVYRWSVAQPVYYSIVSPSASPTLNSLSADSVTITDTNADGDIIGNPILYTTGGVVENIGAPPTSLVTLFNDRLFLVNAENRNLLGYSKQVIENTPVEMSDLLTKYVAPTIGAQGSTGYITAEAPMDDKNILFKTDAIYYINGNGPDNTGANDQYSEPIFVTASVGCSNQNSIVFIPNGLMFQSDKGIWLLGRDLSTSYIGSPVEQFTNNSTVRSAISIPGTNQVRFTMDSGITLLYDYFYGQWGTFTNIPAVSSTLFEGLHTYVDQYGRVYQETPGQYLDNSSPVLMSFTTGWGSLAGLQGYQRFYQMLLLGQYITPFKLLVQLAYDYEPAIRQQVIISPPNFSPAYGNDANWGSGQYWGGPSAVFESRIFPAIERCESFQITMNEIYDPAYGVIAGAGLTLSGLDLVVGIKRGYRTQKAVHTYG